MDLSIIILNYQSRAKLLNCLASIKASQLAGLRYEIIVVDNNSGDDLHDIPAQYPLVRLIMHHQNPGMGAGNNLGIRSSQAEFILILNPDTVMQPSTISVMLMYLREHPEAGLVGPKTLYPDGSLQLSCSRFPSFFLPFLRRTFLGNLFKAERDDLMMSNFDHQSISAVDWLMGSCLMFRRELVVKGETWRPQFDERYFMYFEDTDLARQFRARNLLAIYNPQAVITHNHERGSAKYPWYLAIFVSSLARHHIGSWLKYFVKWGFGRPRDIK
jgi:hypothetical protein